MADCDRFESSYNQWKSGGLQAEAAEWMERHRTQCPECGAFSGETASLRRALADTPKRSISPEFDDILRLKILEIERPLVKRRHIQRAVSRWRWAALGTGLATGLAVGVMLFVAPNDNESQPPNSPSSTPALTKLEKEPLIVVDSLPSNKDSGRVESTPYELDRHLREVSSDR